MATQTIVYVPRTWKSGKKYLLEVTEWEFCDDLWRVIKEFALERPEVIQAIQIKLNRTLNLDWSFLPDNFQAKLATDEDLDFMDLCENNRWRKKCLQVCEDKLKQAKLDVKEVKKNRKFYIERVEKLREENTESNNLKLLMDKHIAEDGQTRTIYFHTCYAKKLLKVCNHNEFYCGCIHKKRNLEQEHNKITQSLEDTRRWIQEKNICYHFSLLPFHLDL